MPRLKNTKTGVVVDIPESLAEHIGGYEPVDKPAGEKESKHPRSRK